MVRGVAVLDSTHRQEDYGRQRCLSNIICASFDTRSESMLSLARLTCFVAVAEELHFGRAAERLHMTQPPLSRQIQLLEKEVGVQLVVRTSRSVTLTPAGNTFLPEARRILYLAEGAVLTARRVPA